MKKVVSIFGTRPEFLKLAPVMMELGVSGKFQSKSLFTKQHEFEFLGYSDFPDLAPPNLLPIDRDPKWSLAELYSTLIHSIAKYLENERPELVLVHGDTATTFAAAMAAFLQRIPVGHVEAGLRTNNMAEPFPEELNRQLVSRIASLNFSPTSVSSQNLLREGILPELITETGNTIVDSLEYLSKRFESDSEFVNSIRESLNSKGITGDYSNKIVLVTAHRRENQGPNFEEICAAVGEAALENPSLVIVFATHPNPELQKRAKKAFGSTPNIFITSPLAYSELIFLIRNSILIVTDSGGIQEEAVSLTKRVLVTRNVTERPEGLTTGLMDLVGTERYQVLTKIRRALNNSDIRFTGLNPYGDGKASKRIVQEIERFLGKEQRGE